MCGVVMKKVFFALSLFIVSSTIAMQHPGMGLALGTAAEASFNEVKPLTASELLSRYQPIIVIAGVLMPTQKAQNLPASKQLRNREQKFCVKKTHQPKLPKRRFT